MIPIHELLARIRWDPEFGAARFEIAYFDRRAPRARALARRNADLVARPGQAARS